MTKQFWRNPGPYDPPGQPLDGRMRATYHEKGKEKKLKLKLKSIAEEANACRKAFKNIAIGSNVVHCHHSREYETLEEPAENRISYILSNKPKGEQALRLRLFRPVKGSALAEYEKVTGPALAEYEKVKGSAHSLICKTKGCTWNGVNIFE